MRQTVQGFDGGSMWSSMTRSRHYLNRPARYVRFVIPTFNNIAVSGSTIKDVLNESKFRYQIGVEYPYKKSYSNIPARKPVHFDGSTIVHYAGATGPGYIVSDIYDFGKILPAHTFFGLWTTQENALGAASPANSLPYQANGCENYGPTGFQRFQGGIASDTTSLVDAHAVLNQTFIHPYGTLQKGATGSVFTPCMMLVLSDPRTPTFFSIGDSICYGIGEGGTGSGAYGDSMGSALGNAGYVARWIYEVLHYDNVNLGRGSDGYKYLYESSNWIYRQNLLKLANPTHIVMQNSHNDIAAGIGAATLLSDAQKTYATIKAILPNIPILQACCTPDTLSVQQPAWAPATKYAAGAVVVTVTGSRYTPYRCKTAGISAASGTGPTGTGTAIADGSCVWEYYLLGSTSVQRPSAGWGTASSARGKFNDLYVRATDSVLGNAGYIDPNPALEFGYQEGVPKTETSIYNATGAPCGYSMDGTHPNSYGHYLAAKHMVAYLDGGSL
jgi:lysophospholipase L1-like esterase